ncbi:hypothetical protein E4U43_003451 [Claviceps pusilla]|uniref:Uncharacterized protein n=1 Tax=Claviceps pusilla TaxID=123648 RepID=A0A9P7NFI6_9HYPO|nr:hypothetical protein E4U43_003451 [Claviceps pusilla]
MTAGDEHEGASTKELLIEACRRNNTDLLTEILEGKPDDEITRLLNDTTTIMGNHLYHEAASRGNYLLLDQPSFECDPQNRLEGDTPLHTAIRWLNAEPPSQHPFGLALIGMMLEAGSNPRVRNKGGLTALQLVDPRNQELRRLIEQHEYANQNAGDFIAVDAGTSATGTQERGHDDDDDAEFSGSDEDERAEWERRRGAKQAV